MFHNKTESLAQNIIAGLTVSFVALSLGAALGIMSGRGALMGMLSAAVIAFITALLGGTRVQCSGPTAPMTVVTATVVAFANQSLLENIPSANPDHFINIVLILTSIAVALMAIFKLGRYISLVPNVVTSGFMNGIALLIFVDQFSKLIKFFHTTPELFNMQLLFVLGTVFIIFFVPVFTRKIMPKWAGLLSGTMLSLIIMTTIAEFFNLPIPRVELGASLGSFSDVLNIFHSQIPNNPNDWSFESLKLAVPFALQLAVLLYLDTMLTSIVVDKMTGEKTQRNKELGAHALATAAVSAFGGIPGAQATIRSVLIIKEGAALRIAGILVGVFALVELILFQDFVEKIPQAVFMGILFKVGYDVLDLLPFKIYIKQIIHYENKPKELSARIKRKMKNLLKEKPFVTNREILFIIGTTIVTVLTNLIIAVLVFSVLFIFLNKFIFKKKPLRDLQPVLETEAFIVED